jgi:hypothetical protein
MRKGVEMGWDREKGGDGIGKGLRKRWERIEKEVGNGMRGEVVGTWKISA